MSRKKERGSGQKPVRSVDPTSWGRTIRSHGTDRVLEDQFYLGFTIDAKTASKRGGELRRTYRGENGGIFSSRYEIDCVVTAREEATKRWRNMAASRNSSHNRRGNEESGQGTGELKIY